MQKFHVIGMGPGDPKYILPIALETISNTEVLFGTGKIISKYAEYGIPKETIPLSGSVENFLDKLENRRNGKRCAVLVSGDPGFYSLLGAVRRRFKPADFNVVPGITSFQLACAKIGLNWQEFRLGSAHGKSLESMLSQITAEQGAVILTDHKHNPAVISRYLIENNWSDRNGWICENISKQDELIKPVTLYNIQERKEYRLCLMILLPSSME